MYHSVYHRSRSLLILLLLSFSLTSLARADVFKHSTTGQKSVPSQQKQQIVEDEASADGSLAAKPEYPVISLTDNDTASLQTGDWLVEFYANWCGACKQFKTEYQAVAQKLQQERPKWKVAAVDIVENPSLGGRFQISSLPSVYHIRNGTVRAPVFEMLTRDALLSSLQSIETAPEWPHLIHPFSALGTGLAGFGWFTGLFVLAYRALPWWTFWVMVAALMGLTVYSVYQEEEEAPEAQILDRREVDRATGAKETVLLAKGKSTATSRKGQSGEARARK